MKIRLSFLNSLKAKLTLSLILVGLITILIFIMYSSRIFEGFIVERYDRQLTVQMNMLNMIIGNKINEIDTFTNFISSEPGLREIILSPDYPNFSEYLRRRVQPGLIDAITVTTSDGTILARSFSDSGPGNLAQDPLVSEALGGRSVNGLFVFSGDELAKEGLTSPEGSGLVIASAYPIYNEGSLIGTVRAVGLVNGNTYLVDAIKTASMIKFALICDDRVVLTNLDISSGERDFSRVDLRDSGHRNELQAGLTLGNKKYFIHLEPLTDSTKKTIGKIVLAIDMAEIRAVAQRVFRGLLIVSLGIIVVAIVFSLWLSATITRPITQASHALEEVGRGNLTVEIKTPPKDEVGAIINILNKVVRSMRMAVSKITISADKVSTFSQSLSSSTQEVSTTSSRVSATVQEIAEGVSVQARKIDEIFALMTQLADSIKKIAQHIEATSQSSQEVTDQAQGGGKAIDNIVSNIIQITKTVDETRRAVKVLGERSQQISEIVQTITSFADQTNLLSLNAAIEAARAGESGRGFAVVAQEIRKLADSSGGASESIGRLIREIKEEIAKTIDSVQSSIADIERGNRSVLDTKGALDKIIKVAKRTASMMGEIKDVTQYQTKDIEEVVRRMDEISQVSEKSATASEDVSAAMQQQVASMEEVTAFAVDLNRVAVELRALVEKFTIS